MTDTAEQPLDLDQIRTLGDVARLVTRVHNDSALLNKRAALVSGSNTGAAQVILTAESHLCSTLDVMLPEKPEAYFMMAFDYIALLTRGQILSDNELARCMEAVQIARVREVA